MKTGLFLAAALAQLAAAQPHRARHQHLHEKRDVVTEIDYVTATAPDVVVFVNQYGDAVSTSYVNPWIKHHHQSTTAPSSSVAVATTVATSAVETSAEATYTYVPESTSAAATSSSASTAAAASSTSSSSSSSGYGLTYSPYNADGSCKTQSQVNDDFETLGEYVLVRMYGVDCDQLNTVGSAAVAKGMKLFAGVYDIAEVNSEIETIIAYASGNWDNFHTVSVGNELINSGEATVAEVVSAVNTARSLLSAAGYTGNVVTVDTWSAVLANPELCEASDYAAINAHAFFDSSVAASGAGAWAADTLASVKAACGKTTMITESGWPSQGDSNGAAVPSKADQATAVASLKSSIDAGSLILFTAYNDLWKTNFDGSFGAEQYWGVYGTSTAS